MVWFPKFNKHVLERRRVHDVLATILSELTGTALLAHHDRASDTGIDSAQGSTFFDKHRRARGELRTADPANPDTATPGLRHASDCSIIGQTSDSANTDAAPAAPSSRSARTRAAQGGAMNP